MNDLSKPVSQEFVFEHELEFIELRREAIRSEKARILETERERIQAEIGAERSDALIQETIEYGSSFTASNSSTSSSLQKSPTGFESGTVGLALSGGGIRSASFNLGVLQAMAQQKLISNLDYLSTVSGGGYIGSWLSAWIIRDGSPLNVEKLLTPAREVNATAARNVQDKTFDEKQVFGTEPDPIRHLREFSNFLAPQPGLFSTDSWTLLAIYLRNVLLNGFVLLPTLVAVQLFAMCLAKLFREATNTHQAAYLSIGFVLFAVMFFLLFKTFSQSRIRVSRGVQKYGGLEFNFWTRSFKLPVFLLVLGCYFITLHIATGYQGVANLLSRLLAWFGAKQFSYQPENWDQYYVIWLSVFFGLLHTIPNLASYRKLLSIRSSLEERKGAVKWIFSGFVAGMLIGILGVGSFWIVYRPLEFLTPKEMLCELQLTLIVPMLLWTYFIAESVQIGILGRMEEREIREKWSFFHSYSFMASCGWLFLFGHAFILPNLLERHFYHWIPAAGSWALWAATSSMSLWLASSDATGAKKRSYADVLVKLGPPVIISGAFVLVALCTREILDFNNPAPSAACYFGFAVASSLMAVAAGFFVDVNVFSLQELYQNRLVRAFLGASRPKKGRVGAPFRSSDIVRTPDPITGIDSGDDIDLKEFDFGAAATKSHTGQPLHLINTAINLQGENELEYQERQADSFTLSPLYSGCPRTKYRRTSDGYGGNITLGRAFAISGAAVSPNMGYYTSPAVTALLTFFNLRLGAWLPNPRMNQWASNGPKMGWLQLMMEMLGLTTSQSPFVYLSDGGHFDNLGVYELLRRRCRFIVSSDGGADPTGSCHELAMIVRKAQLDFGIEIDIDLSTLSTDPASGLASARAVVGRVHYPPKNLDENGSVGYLVYIKSVMDGSEPADIQSYKRQNTSFPHQSTVDQFFSESQFESYRHLGYIIADRFFSRTQAEFVEGHPVRRPALPRSSIDVQRYFEYLAAIESMPKNSQWDKLELRFNEDHCKLEADLRGNPLLAKLQIEIGCITNILDLREHQLFNVERKSKKQKEKERDALAPEYTAAGLNTRTAEETRAELAWAVRAIRLLSDVMRTLKLDSYHSSLSRGWMRVARRWMLNSAFRVVWPSVKGDYARAFGTFVDDLQNDEAWSPQVEKKQERK